MLDIWEINDKHGQRAMLEAAADRIEEAIGGRVTGGSVTPRWILFKVIGVNGIDPDRAAQKLRDLGDVQVKRRGAAVDVMMYPPSPLPVSLERLTEQIQQTLEIPPRTAVLGINADGQPLMIRFTGGGVVRSIAAPQQVVGTMMSSFEALNPTRDLHIASISSRCEHIIRERERIDARRPTIVFVGSSDEVRPDLVKRGAAVECFWLAWWGDEGEDNSEAFDVRIFPIEGPDDEMLAVEANGKMSRFTLAI